MDDDLFQFPETGVGRSCQNDVKEKENVEAEVQTGLDSTSFIGTNQDDGENSVMKIVNSLEKFFRNNEFKLSSNKTPSSVVFMFEETLFVFSRHSKVKSSEYSNQYDPDNSPCE